MWWLLAGCMGFAGDVDEEQLREGDLVFQDSRSSQAGWIREATDSPWSHVGVVVELSDRRVVLEAVEPVRLTEWEVWKARGDGVFGARRLEGITDADRASLVSAGEKMLGRPYDLAFAWDDDRLYCSELVTKLFAEVGVTLGERERVDDFPLTPEMRAGLEQRGIPLDREVVTPASIYADPDLIPVE